MDPRQALLARTGRKHRSTGRSSCAASLIPPFQALIMPRRVHSIANKPHNMPISSTAEGLPHKKFLAPGAISCNSWECPSFRVALSSQTVTAPLAPKTLDQASLYQLQLLSPDLQYEYGNDGQFQAYADSQMHLLQQMADKETSPLPIGLSYATAPPGTMTAGSLRCEGVQLTVGRATLHRGLQKALLREDALQQDLQCACGALQHPINDRDDATGRCQVAANGPSDHSQLSASLRQDKTALLANADAARREYETVAEQLDESRATLQSLISLVVQLSTRVQSSKNTIKDQSKAIKTLQSKKQEAIGRAEVAEGQASNFERQVSAFEDQSKKYEVDSQRAHGSLQAAEDRVEALQRESAGKSGTILELEATVERQQQALLYLHREKDEALAAAQTDRESTDKWKSEWLEMQRANATLQTCLSTVQKQVANVERLFEASSKASQQFQKSMVEEVKELKRLQHEAPSTQLEPAQHDKAEGSQQAQHAQHGTSDLIEAHHLGSQQMCVAEDEQARALAPIGPVEGYSSSEEESAMVRGAVRDARAKAAPPAAPTPQIADEEVSPVCQSMEASRTAVHTAHNAISTQKDSPVRKMKRTGSSTDIMGLTLAQDARTLGSAMGSSSSRQEPMVHVPAANTVQATPSSTGKVSLVPGAIGGAPFPACNIKLRQCEIDGQEAIAYYLQKTQETVATQRLTPFPLRTDEMASKEYEFQALDELYDCTGLTRMEGGWEWEVSTASPAVRILKTIEDAPQIGVLGQGVNGKVHYAEVAMADGTVQAAALKKVAYSHPVHQYAFNAELAALRDAEGCPHLGQCIAVFKHEDKNEGGSCLSILLEYAEGYSMSKACAMLRADACDSPDRRKVYMAALRTLFEHVVKATAWLHERGRAHCDIKSDNLRVRIGPEGSATVERVTVIDLGCSVKYQGPANEKPLNMGLSWGLATPETVKSTVNTSEHLDACAQDIWSIGTLLLYSFTLVSAWQLGDVVPSAKSAPQLLQLHNDWAQVHALPDHDSRRQEHPIFMGLNENSENDVTGFLSSLVQHMLHPAVNSRAKIQDVLSSGFFPLV